MMDRNEVVLAILAASNGEPYSPVQLQKSLFLVDRTLGHRIGGPFFDFQPYDYGPFDAGVYDTTTALNSKGLVEIRRDPGTSVRKYLATPDGMEIGKKILDELNPGLRQYLTELSEWVRAQTFSSLVSSIYRKYPEMKTNSVFRG
jgi:hypothetical protein